MRMSSYYIVLKILVLLSERGPACSSDRVDYVDSMGIS
jgi:hypothetical protein